MKIANANSKEAKSKKLRGVKCWTNGFVNKYSFEKPENFELGFVGCSPIKGKKIWNNGLTNIASDFDPGETWILGKLYDRGKWWTDGIHEIYAKECPENYTHGRSPISPDTKKKMSGAKKGKKHFHNGIIEICVDTMPLGDEWQKGKLPGKKWWTDGTHNKRSIESPGDEWKRGRIFDWTFRRNYD